MKPPFYTIVETTRSDHSLTALLRLHAEHPLYQGHFPGQPVVPGVCLLEMTRELACLATGMSLQLSRADTMKFIKLLIPQDTPTLEATLNYEVSADGSVSVSAIVTQEKTPCFRFKGHFRELIAE